MRTLILSLLLIPVVAQANGATYGGTGSDIYPIENHEISMKREHILLTVQGDDAGWWTSSVVFDCRFEFVNHGKATTIRMGFPLAPDGLEDFAPDSSAIGFRVKVDGTPVKVTSAKRGLVLLWPVHFEKNQTRLVRVEYVMPWGTADMALYPLSTAYVLKTGALWRDPIESSVIELTTGPRTPFPSLSLDPAPTVIERGVARWEYENVRPAQDIRIRFSPGLAEKFEGRFVSTFRPEDHPLRASREFLDLIEGEWEESLTYSGDRDSSIDTMARNEIEAEAQGWRFSLEIQANSHKLDPLEKLNLEYARAVETACQTARTNGELAQRLAAVHERFW